MKRVPFFLLSAFLVLPISVSFAQEPLPPRQQPQHAPDGGTLEMISSIFIPSWPNSPFTATVSTTWVRQLPDGSTIAWKNHRTIARDATGRIFQERRHDLVGEQPIERPVPLPARWGIRSACSRTPFPVFY